MSDSFAPATVLEGSGNVLPVTHGDDTRFAVEFYTREVEDEKETQRLGRRILKGMPYCRKRAMGDPRTVWDAPATDIDKQRWPMLWSAYERGEHDMVVGTPLDSWPLLTREARISLKNWGYKTVDQIAEVTDAALLAMDKDISRVIAQVRNHAQKFIEEQAEGETERRLASELEARDNEITLLRNQMMTMQAQIERMNSERLAAPVVQPQETGPGFQAPVPPKQEKDPGLAALEALPQLEPAEPETPVAEMTAPLEPPSLTDEQIAEILASDEKATVLGPRYGVSWQAISGLRRKHK